MKRKDLKTDSQQMSKIAGLILLIAQLSNFLASLPPTDTKWTLTSVIQSYATLPLTNLLGWIFTLILSLVMLYTQKLFAKTVIATIFYFIVINFVNLDFRFETNGFFITAGNIIGNGIFFVYILRFYLSLKNQPLIDLEGYGSWAHLAQLSDEFVQLESFREPPERIASEELELVVDEEKVVRLRYDHHIGDKYVFRRIS